MAAVVRFCKDYMDHLEQKENLDLTSSYDELLLWTVAFFYYLIDRWAHEELEENREIFMQNFDKSIIIEVKRQFDVSDDDMGLIADNLQEKTNYFTPFAKTILPEKGVSPKGTLLWELDKVFMSKLNCSIGSTLFANEMLGFYLEHLNPLVRKALK
jgi:hypothetical protein